MLESYHLRPPLIIGDRSSAESYPGLRPMPRERALAAAIDGSDSSDSKMFLRSLA